MREQLITPRAGRSVPLKGRAGGGVTQRPARRGAAEGAGRREWKGALAYLPLAGKILLAVCAGVLVFLSYGAARSAAFFQLSFVDVEGTARASKEEIRAAVRRAVAAKGVWRADLAAINVELERQPWVRTAVVSRVMPSGLRVRITEREPRVVVRTSAGRFVWVDEDAFVLGAASPGDQVPPFFIRGLDETPTDAARQQNRERIRKGLEMMREWEQSGLAARVSEVNLDDLRDVRAQLAGDDSQIEVRLGREDFGRRLARALKVLDETPEESPRGPVTRLDATQDKRVIVGFSSGAQSQGESFGGSGDRGAAHSTATAGAARRDVKEGRPSERREKSQAQKDGVGAAAKRRSGEQPKRGAREEHSQTPAASGGQQRPRRVRIG